LCFVPVTDALSRLRIGRVASVLIAVVLAFAILGVLGALIDRQAAQLSENLPAYQVEIGKKLDAVRSLAFGARMVEKAADALHGLENNIGKNAVPAPSQPTVGQTALGLDHPLVQVEVHEPPPGPVQIVQSIFSALLPRARLSDPRFEQSPCGRPRRGAHWRPARRNSNARSWVLIE
jgi:hypothetical protein